MKTLAVLESHIAPPGFMETAASLCAARGVACRALACRSGRDVARQAHQADAAVCFFSPIDAGVLSSLPRLKMIVRAGIGVDTINLADCTRHGVLVCNVPDYGVEEVAVHTLALILALERKIVPYTFAVREGVWDQELGPEMRRVSERNLGLLGFGRTARKLADLAGPLGYALFASDPYVSEVECEAAGVRKCGPEDLFAQSDVLAVMAPATRETRHIVNDKTLASAKAGLLLVNTSRGSLADTGAVLRALQRGTLGGAALDVLEEEPPGDAFSALTGQDNLILTPHVAYRSQESLAALNSMSVRIALDYLCDGTIRNLINTDASGTAAPCQPAAPRVKMNDVQRTDAGRQCPADHQ